LCIILSGDIQLNPGPISKDTEILTTNHVDPTRSNSLIDRTNTNDTSQTYDLTFVPNPQNISTPERSKKTKRNTLNAILINTNSIKSITKTTQLKTTIQSNNPDIMFLVETKIDENYPTYSFLPPNYNAIRKDRSIHGGGVLIAFRDDIVAEPLTNLNSNCEIVWTKVHFTRNKSIYFASYYRPPNDHLQLLEALHESLTKLYRTQKIPPNVVIAGDFNLPDINWSKQQITNNRTASKHNKLLEIINKFGLQNMLNNPTRIDSGNILDLILTSNPSIIVNTHTTPGMSDHEAVTFNVNLNPVRNRKPPHKIFQYKSANWDKLKDDINQLTSTYFHRNPNSRDINENWNFFRNNLTSLVDRNIPSRNTKAKAHLPWITREIIRMQRKRNKSHKKAKQTGRNSDWEKFRQLRRQASKAAAKSYSDYLNNHIGESLKTNPKQFWSFMKVNKRECIGIPTLQTNGQIITNDRDKANTLNNHFSSVFTQEIYPIPKLSPSVYSDIPFLEIGIDGVVKQLKNINQNKATGPDELPARVLKEAAAEITPIITHIFQQSYNTSKLPDDWLQALVTPIHKKSLKSDPANYRPISLTCILCKVMEHIILSNMWKHLHKHNILLHFQHGFQSGLSCESQLIETVHDWITAMDNKSQIDAILLDFAKAFDKVPHKRLLSKLAFYGITGNTKNWIKSFLSHRKQRVSVNGALSDNTCVTSGVPQGSVLGPVLFLLYINDINNNIQSPIRLFADDSIIYRIIKSETDNNILQSDLIQLQTWSNKWQMEFNIPKCVHLPITNKTKPRLHSYSLCGVPLSTVSSHPYLGIKLDTKLTWANHITDIASKSSKVLGMIKRTLGPCKPNVKETAYNMLVRPKLEYASPIWNPHTTTQIKHLEKVQHCAARFVKNNHRRQTATTDLIATLGWPTLERRRIIKQAMTFYKILNNIINITPPPGLLKPSKNRGHYIATRCRINTAVFSFYPRAIRIWNMIPPHITAIENPIAFQAAIMNLPFPTPNHLNCL
jgi:hypothetical protein